MSRLQQLASTGLFDARVPRYTSYPPSPNFSDRIGATEVARWIGKIQPDTKISLYLHIPFCQRLCWFCACRTQGVRTPEPVAAYVETLKQEIDILASLADHPLKVERIHWGGGTPTILSPDQIDALADRVHKKLDTSQVEEFSVEIDPTLVDKEKIAALAAAGMNRASIGVQDFTPRIQEAIGRIQTFEQTAEVVTELRRTGISSLNTDILYGLPGQDDATIRHSTKLILELDPDRIALFGYAHVPWVARRQRMIDANLLPDPHARLRLMEEAEDMFGAAGYVPVGIDHHAKPADAMTRAAAAGKLHRNFQGYTDDAAPILIGLGASAISRYPQGYAQNAGATASYTARIRDGQAATARGYAMRLEDQVRAAFIERLLCDLTVDLGALHDTFGDFADLLTADLNRAIGKYGTWLGMEHGLLTLTPEGKPLARLIASEFDSFFKETEARHSSAI